MRAATLSFAFGNDELYITNSGRCEKAVTENAPPTTCPLGTKLNAAICEPPTDKHHTLFTNSIFANTRLGTNIIDLKYFHLWC